jgi:ribosomal protein S18 acetylase RimI-like enzyme
LNIIKGVDYVGNFVIYDPRAHRDLFLKLNVEHLNWFVEEAVSRHSIDLSALEGPSIQEYVEAHLDEFTSIRPPKGIIYMVEAEGTIVGMGILRELEEGVGEIKRMYIRPKYRRRGFGKALLKMLMEKAEEFGFSTLRLDTADFMIVAQNIYRSAGFKEIGEYAGSEIPEWYRPYTVFMEKILLT